MLVFFILFACDLQNSRHVGCIIGPPGKTAEAGHRPQLPARDHPRPHTSPAKPHGTAAGRQRHLDGGYRRTSSLHEAQEVHSVW